MSELARGVKRQSGAMRDAYPDQQAMVVLTDHANNTYDVQRPGWGGSRKLTRITNVNPDIVGQISVDDTVLVGYYNGNPQQAAILSKAGFLLAAAVTDATVALGVYAKALPLTALLWAIHGHDEGRSRATGEVDLIWRPRADVDAYPLALAPVVGPPRAFGNRVLLVVGGAESDERITSKLGDLIAPLRVDEDVYTAQFSPYKLRIVHQNIAQGSDDGAVDEPGNGDETDFALNLRFYDISLEDAVGITWDAGEAPGGFYVVPVEMALHEYVQRQVVREDATQQREERIWATIVWAAPTEQGSVAGRKWAYGRDGTGPNFLSAGSARFFISRHLINIRRTYLVGVDAIGIRDNPLYENGSDETSLSEITLMLGPTDGNESVLTYQDPSLVPDYLTIHDLPAGFTSWVTELTYAPITVVNRGEDPQSTELGDVSYDVLTAICCEPEAETGIATLWATRVNAVTGVELDTTELELDTPAVYWDHATEANFFDGPDSDSPWYTAALRYGDDYAYTFGMVTKGGYLNGFIFHRKANGDIVAIAQWSYASQVAAWLIPVDGAPTAAWSVHGWDTYPSSYRVYTVCGIYNVTPPTEEQPDLAATMGLLVHFEEFEQQAMTALWRGRADYSGMQAYEAGWETPPAPGSEGYFTMYDYPRPGGYDYAFEVDDEIPGRYGGNSTEAEIEEIFDHVTGYWADREDADGWEQVDVSNARFARRQGFAILDVEDGSTITEEYVLIVDGVMSVPSGPLICEWFESEFVDRYVDPATVADANGDVWITDPPDPENPGIHNSFGCVPPLAAGYIESHSKSWSVRYEWDAGPEEYLPPVWGYLRSSTDPGSDVEWEGEAWAIDTQGDFQPPPDESERGDFSSVSWGRRFYCLRFSTATTEYPIEDSIDMPFSPTRCAFLVDVAVFLMQQKAWNIPA